MTTERVGLSVRLARRRSLRFPKRSMPLNRCSSLAASFSRIHHSLRLSMPCAIPVPALRPCLTNTAFASSLVRSASLHCATSPVSIISGDGYSIFKVQCRTNIFLTFALPCITLNPYLDIVFKDFVPVHKDKNRKIFIFLRQLNELFAICPNYGGVYMEKLTLSADIFDGQEHYRFADADLSDYNTAFPNSLISFMYMNVSSANNMMDGFEQMV